MPARESRLPVGSSAKMISGVLASARAAATRCCWPPDSSLGRCFKREPRPVIFTTSSSAALSAFFPAMVSGSTMLSSADRVGTRLYD